MTQTINLILSVLTFLAQTFLLWVLVFSLISFKNVRKIAAKFLSEKNVIFAAFVISLLATGGSLYYSQIAGFAPCELCWFQRIFMYPQVIILGLALVKKEGKIIVYSLLLASIGALISLWHNYIIYISPKSTTCLASSVSCATKFVLGLGYVTIPLMALTAFALIIMLFVGQKISIKK